MSAPSRRRLPWADGGDVRACELVDEAVPVRVGTVAKALAGLHPVMMLERIVRELPQLDYAARLVKRVNGQGRLPLRLPALQGGVSLLTARHTT